MINHSLTGAFVSIRRIFWSTSTYFSANRPTNYNKHSLISLHNYFHWMIFFFIGQKDTLCSRVVSSDSRKMVIPGSWFFLMLHNKIRLFWKKEKMQPNNSDIYRFCLALLWIAIRFKIIAAVYTFPFRINDMISAFWLYASCTLNTAPLFFFKLIWLGV